MRYINSLLLTITCDGCMYRNADVHLQATVAARELPVGSLTKNESLSDELIDRLNAMADLSHPSIIKMFGVVNPASAPMLVSVILLLLLLQCLKKLDRYD